VSKLAEKGIEEADAVVLLDTVVNARGGLGHWLWARGGRISVCALDNT
jgi:hypothetical protein